MSDEEEPGGQGGKPAASAAPAGRHLLVGGGGTGGHVFPALAVAGELERRGWAVSWSGRRVGMERDIVAARGLPYHALPARAVLGRGPLGRAAALAVLAVAALGARRLVRRRRVSAVLGTGGFVSAPAVLGARLAGRPAVLLEPNAEAGAANRWLSRWARAAAVGYAETGAALRCPARLTGVPVREAFFATPPPAATGPVRLLVLGGSQGALQLNRLLPAALAELGPVAEGLKVLHQTGAAHLKEVRRTYAERPPAAVEVETVPFLDDVAAAMAGAHLVVSRAGAVTLAEICAAGRAALLVPLAWAAGHQVENAERLAASGGARLLGPGEQTVEACRQALAELLADRAALAAMGGRLRRLARPAAAREIADLVEEVLAA